MPAALRRIRRADKASRRSAAQIGIPSVSGTKAGRLVDIVADVSEVHDDAVWGEVTSVSAGLQALAAAEERSRRAWEAAREAERKTWVDARDVERKAWEAAGEAARNTFRRVAIAFVLAALVSFVAHLWPGALVVSCHEPMKRCTCVRGCQDLPHLTSAATSSAQVHVRDMSQIVGIWPCSCALLALLK